jgi:ribosomal protein L17
MNTKANDGSPFDISKILDAFRQITAFEVVLVSVFLVAWLAGAWLGVLNQLELSLTAKYWILASLAVLYVIGVILVLVERHRRIIAVEAKEEADRKAKEAKEEAERIAEEAKKEKEAARDEIIAYIDRLRKTTPNGMVLYKTLKKINPSYSPEFLDSLVHEYPRILAKRRRKADGKPLMDKL